MNRSVAVVMLLSCLLLPLTSCANSGFGQALQDSLAADPKLKEAAPNGTLPIGTSEPQSPTQAQLPADFPEAIPQYPNATLQAVRLAAEGQTNRGNATDWQTIDSRDRVLAFYREKLPTNGWQLAESSLTQPSGTIVAQQNDLQVVVTPASEADQTGTSFTIQYTQAVSVAQSPSPTPSSSVSPSPQADAAKTEAFLGVAGTSDGSEAEVEPFVPLTPNAYSDLNKAPKEFSQYLSDLAQLGVLNLSSGKDKSAMASFSPNKPISRREYIRWLFDTNNRLYRDRVAQQIRPASAASQPAFRDVPRTDPDFAAIQGLAEAGILPSALSGDPASVTLRPDAQLSREIMLLWKVPIDTRQPLPTANLETLKQTWGFQDLARIDPKAQRAVLADYQNADLSNIRRVFGYTTLFQPKKPVTRAEAAASLWYVGYQGDGVSAQEALKGK